MVKKEYIEREAAKWHLYKEFIKDKPTACKAFRALETTPAADVVEVVRGHWVWPCTERDRPYCSECLNDAFWDNDHGFVTENYCPNCGAKMDGGDNP